jgi:hypothetical protein
MKKSWVEKLRDSKGLPKVETIKDKGMERWGGKIGEKFVVPAPVEVDAIMKKVPRGKVITGVELRSALAKKHKAALCCPLTSGIFTWISAYAAEEEKKTGKIDTTPWWRTVKTGGELNGKYPGGAENQKKLLAKEGIKVASKGKKLMISDLEKHLIKI